MPPSTFLLAYLPACLPAVATTGETRVRKQFLVKWKGLPYAECTWEWEAS